MTTETLEIDDIAVGLPEHGETQAGAWWLEVAELRERIERRRAREGGRAHAAPARRRVAIEGRGAAGVPPAASAPGPSLRERDRAQGALPVRGSARTPRRRASGADWLAAKPDRLAAWAVALGFLLVIAGLLSAH